MAAIAGHSGHEGENLLVAVDLILLGVLVQGRVGAETAVLIALVDPLQVFRTAAMMLVDPELVLVGPAALVIFDLFSRQTCLAFAMLYPVALASLCVPAGFLQFRRADLP